MRLRLGLLLTVLSSWLSSRAYAANFTFSYGNPTQCDDFSVSWTGGTPPFQLSLIPAFDVPLTTSIPSSNFSNGKGSFQVQLPFAQKQQILVVMSDASGFASGGISNVLSVGPSTSGSQCNTTDRGLIPSVTTEERCSLSV
ncbi:hypothetical protein AcW1_000697 [Taiwanofungus camphoratus]|nr:hypothetical protein AcW2_000802 [Antrodia cinnamomea]KAI0936461.1 hypothetical protein AcV5_004596 [Antrodia cinnamomea]KAI0961675.1 hypothetical protein AcV7_000716 [Antrodia cinnamomea]KAI0963690.1 hypothetical protein AcW1_000697 [Antrodia cinnamomea]